MTENDARVLANLPDWDPPADIVEARLSWERHAARYLNNDLAKIGALHERVDLGNGLRADIAVPVGLGPFPVVLYLHGGGWAFGSPTSFRKVAMSFAAHGVVCVNLDYRLAPDHPFPAALDDVAAAVEWIARNIGRLGGDARRIAIGGDSAGGNLAMAAALRSGDAFRQRISGLLLLYGVFDLAAALARANHHPGLTLQVNNYIGTTAISDPLVSPLRASVPPTLPPCFLLEGGADRFVGGEAQALARVLQRAGVEHELHIIEGMPHGFLQVFELDGCQTGWQLMIDFIKRHP